ncbi:MAG: type 4a pilus biogenesis protein PilO [Steroidobacteraceae bacterium]
MNWWNELQSLDPRDPGRWPLPVRVGAVVLCFVLLTALGFYLFVWQGRQPELQQRYDVEAQLRNEYTTKHAKAVNLPIYKQQLADIEKSFGAMLRQLPSKTEVDSVLVDISQAGLGAALNQKLFQPEQEVKKDFYAERPIKIRLTGSYHEFGAFVSAIAALPRIVTLHDIEIKQADAKGSFDQLQMDVVAKTYRYMDDDEVANAEADKRKAGKGGR